MKSITVAQLKNKSNIELIDVRGRLEYFLGKKAPNAKNIPMMKLMMQPKQYLDKSTEYHIVCAAGGRSMQVCQQLNAQGYKVINVSGGMNAY